MQASTFPTTLTVFVLVAHEMAGSVEGSMATKMTVQWNLFGGTVLKLGTERVRNDNFFWFVALSFASVVCSLV